MPLAAHQLPLTEPEERPKSLEIAQTLHAGTSQRVLCAVIQKIDD